MNDRINTALGLAHDAPRWRVETALRKLVREAEEVRAARAEAEAELGELRAESAELFIQAIRGCNQYGHKKGCPEAGGGGSVQPAAKSKTSAKRAPAAQAASDANDGVKKYEAEREAIYEEERKALDHISSLEKAGKISFSDWSERYDATQAYYRKKDDAAATKLYREKYKDGKRWDTWDKKAWDFALRKDPSIRGIETDFNSFAYLAGREDLAENFEMVGEFLTRYALSNKSERKRIVGMMKKREMARAQTDEQRKNAEDLFDTLALFAAPYNHYEEVYSSPQAEKLVRRLNPNISETEMNALVYSNRERVRRRKENPW